MQAEGAGSEERGDLRDGRKHTDEVPGHKRGGEKKVPVNYGVDHDEEEEERHLD